ncbi:hypothetical protein C7H84_00750 [Burkholderia sp. Nafp2/4-1b]|nr:hypothetical protein C7H84_00750 [Burkholderia sp. Nafp2/4-1b]
MPVYLNLNGGSGISSYETGPDFINVTFAEGIFRTYSYTHARPGATHVEAMKRLAIQGYGLNAYINSNPAVKHGYASRA